MFLQSNRFEDLFQQLYNNAHPNYNFESSTWSWLDARMKDGELKYNDETNTLVNTDVGFVSNGGMGDCAMVRPSLSPGEVNKFKLKHYDCSQKAMFFCMMSSVSSDTSTPNSIGFHLFAFLC